MKNYGMLPWTLLGVSLGVLTVAILLLLGVGHGEEPRFEPQHTWLIDPIACRHPSTPPNGWPVCEP